MRRHVPAEPPVGVEVAAHRFAAVCSHDGWNGCVVLTCANGHVDCMTYRDLDGTHTLALMEGKWFDVSGADHGD